MSYQSVDMVYGWLGQLRDSMSPEEVRAVQDFLERARKMVKEGETQLKKTCQHDWGGFEVCGKCSVSVYELEKEQRESKL